MDSLLPSEIARLVLGYLEEQKCEEAARAFLEMSPHLQECRVVTSTGRRFSTRVNGFTLADILDKFCAANSIIHERLSKVSDCEQLKHCGDLLEQLRFLVDGSRGQRFVVNINVPTTTQASGGSPIISSSIRKRHHSGSDRDRSKRAHKAHSQSLGKSSEPVSSQLSCDAVETTPLEHLPGHSGSEKMENTREKSLEKSLERLVNCSSSKVGETAVQSLTENPHNSVESIKSTLTSEIIKTSMEKEEKIHERCSTATDTEELMHYTNTEVQTTYSVPYDVAESENESNNEPVENLSLLTKELLNRIELQERIAENINKAILPSDISLRDISMSDSIGGEMNTSIMTELNNAIKSVVTATESDPVFAQFLDEIIGPDGENDTSPDEDGDHQPFSNEEVPPCETDAISKETVTEIFEKIASQEQEITEVPLKNRLRSSSSQQPIRPEDDRGSQKLVAKDDAALEDVNAAAILSIINANSKMEEEKSSMEITTEMLPLKLGQKTVSNDEDDDIMEIATVTRSISAEVEKSIVPPVGDTKNIKKSNFRKPRVMKSKGKIGETKNEGFMSEEEIMAMPTLIVSSKEEITTLMGPQSTINEPIPGGYCSSLFLPIAPKGSEVIPVPPKPAPVYLRTVTVPTKIPNNVKIPEKPLPNLQLINIARPPRTIRSNAQTIQEKPKNTNEIENIAQTSLTTVLPEIPASDGKETDKMMLYGNESNAIALPEDSSIPKVQTDAPFSVSGTGLSPFLKFNNGKPDEKSSETSATINVQPNVEEIPSTSKQENFELITKRTPRSLLKSRSKNNRLSLSTPRRRSSHIRALDFNTPTKYMNSSRRMSINESIEFSSKNSSFAKKVCRTSLFKSPPFAATTSTKKIKSPMKDRATCKIPIATRSPAPKLMGGWEKYTGVGMILGCSSPSSASCSPVKSAVTSQSMKKNWDEDLRKSLQISEEMTIKPGKKVTARKPQKRRITKKIVPSNIFDNTEGVSNDSETREITKESDKKPPKNTTALPVCPEKEEIPVREKILDESKMIEIPCEEKLPKKVLENSLDLVDSAKNTEIIAGTKNIVKTPMSNDSIPKTDKIVKKKYAQLKTITTSVTKIDQDNLMVTSEKTEKTGEFSRVYPEANRSLQLGNILELETPRKFENSFGIPPTPRLLSPNSNLTIPFSQINEETSKVRGFVSTPEFPPTPSIAITPKQISNDTTEATKKDEFLACSTYYQPSSELKDPRMPKQQNDQTRHDMSLPLPGMSLAISTEKRVKNISSQVAQGFQASTTSEKWEITQFEVIKENLPREEAFRELNISSCSNETSEVEKNRIDNQREVNEAGILGDIQDAKDPNNTSSTIDGSVDDSSDSDSSSSSDSSTSSSSSSSSCSSATNTEANITNKTRKTPSKIYEGNEESAKKLAAPPKAVTILQEQTTKTGSTEDNGNIIRLQVSRDENEASPQKVFSISKTDEELVEVVTETPAKDESLLSEAVISETPSSSKAAIETTNLNSKISALITLENREKTNENNEETNGMKKALPIVVSVQRILPNVSIAMKPASGSSDPLYNAMQCRNQANAISDAKLSRQLEEKRLRVVAKFKEKEKNLVHRPRIKRAVCVTGAKRENREKEENDLSMSEEIQGKDSLREKSPDGREKDSKDKSPDGKDKDSLKEKSSDEQERNQSVTSSDDQGRDTKQKEEELTRKLKNEEKDKNQKKETQSKSLKKHKDEKRGEGERGEKEKIPEVPIPIKEVTKEENKDFVSRSTETYKKQADNENKKKLTTSKSKSHLVEKERDKNEEQTRTKLEETSEKFTDIENIGNLQVSEEILHSRIAEITKKDKKECNKELAPVEMKIVTKSKVDLVKRDLFSDDESNDQRTTRSRTRQTSDAQKIDRVDSPKSVLSHRRPSKDSSSSCPKDLPGVLECLELVPTTKIDSSEGNVFLDTSHQNNAEYHFIYDDSVPTKRRRRKFSISELEFPVEVELTDENYRICPKLMTATVFEEMFSISPARKRRGQTTRETIVKTTKNKKNQSHPSKSAKTVFKDIQEQPLATSSPVLKVTQPSKVAGKGSRSPGKKTETPQVESKKKSTLKGDTKQQSDHGTKLHSSIKPSRVNYTENRAKYSHCSVAEKQNPKTRKRKASTSRERELQVDKKLRSTNPQILLNKVDLDKFLTTVHGPA